MLNFVNLYGLKLDDKSEGSADAPDRRANNATAKLAAYLTAYVQAESNTARVDLLGLLDKPVELEELLHVLLLNSCASVAHTNLQHVFVSTKRPQPVTRLLLKSIVLVQQSDSNLDFAMVRRELERV